MAQKDRKLPLTDEKFTQIYYLIFITLLIVASCSWILVKRIFIPQAEKDSVVQIETLILSQDKSVLSLNDTRSLRSTLLEKKIISEDQQFQLLKANEASTTQFLRKYSRTCEFITDHSCRSSHALIVYSEPPQNRLDLRTTGVGIVEPNLANNEMAKVELTAFFLVVLTAAVLSMIAYKVRREQKELSQKLLTVFDSYISIKDSALDSAKFEKGEDEYSLLSKGFQELRENLKKQDEVIDQFQKNKATTNELEQLGRAKAHASHDLKSDLAEGIVVLDYLKTTIENPTPSQTRMIEAQIKRFKNGIQNITATLQNLAQGVVKKVDVAIDAMAANLVERCKIHPATRNLKIKIVAAPALLRRSIYVDRNAIEGALFNLVLNAAQARGDATVSIRFEEFDSRSLRIIVCDNGPGVSDSIRARLFNEFITTKSGGNGVGLSSVKNLIEVHGGTVSLIDATNYQTQESGAHFEIVLPMGTPVASDEGAHA